MRRLHCTDSLSPWHLDGRRRGNRDVRWRSLVLAATGRRRAYTATRTPTATHLPAPSATGTPAAGCDPNYVNLCIPPPPPDLDCAEVRVMLRAQGLTVVELLPGGSDPHRLDGDGDGRGCEVN